jgi:hypothetical protein
MWCKTHPRYSAKREPFGLCKRCWSLYFYKNPEAKEVLQRTYREAEALKGDL